MRIMLGKESKHIENRRNGHQKCALGIISMPRRLVASGDANRVEYRRRETAHY